jgi:hypothetical protein
MVLPSLVILHTGTGLDTTLFEYLSRVALYLFAFSGIAGIVFWGIDVVRTIHSGIVDIWDERTNAR